MQEALAVAAQLPSGYTRTLLPAYVRSDGKPYLPFFGYTAVAFREGKPWVAALQSDSNPHWQPRHYDRPDLLNRLRELRAQLPEPRFGAVGNLCYRIWLLQCPEYLFGAMGGSSARLRLQRRMRRLYLLAARWEAGLSPAALCLCAQSARNR